MRMKKFAAALTALFIFAVTVCGMTVFAEDGRTVRIGYYYGDSALQDGYSDGSRKSGYAYEYYQEIATFTGWRYEYIYGSRQEIADMLANGGVDIAAGIYMTPETEKDMLFPKLDMGLEGEKQYFAVSGKSPEVLSELDYAMEQIRLSYPDYPVTLRQKYYSQSTRQILTDREKQWLAEKKVVRAGYVRYNLPVSDCDKNGRPAGLVRDLTEIMSAYLDISIVPVAYENITEMEEALSSGGIDAAFPAYSDLWLTEKKGFKQTDSFISDRVMIVYQGSYTDDLMDRIALSETGIGQRNYLATYYPDSEVIFYRSREEAFNAIVRGEERCIVGCSSILQRFLKEHPEYQDMNIAYLDTSEDFGIEVNGGNSILTGILNKAIRQIDPAAISGLMVQYSAVETSFTLTDFVRKYSIFFIAAVSLVFMVLLLVFITYRRKTRLFNIEQDKTRAALEEAYDAAKVANEAKTTFLSSMSHDIRTPMNAIIGMTAIAEKHIDDTERVKDCLEKINLSGHYLMTLINDILDISKIESGKLALNPAQFSICDTVSALVNIVRPQIRAKDLEFEVHIRSMDREILYADEVRLNQIFVNILTNSVKYTPVGGRITMDLSEELLPDGKSVRLTYVVEDTGIGMSEDFMENMYDIFARAHDSRINTIQGTGLGLSIVKQMVDMMGGTIECQSELGKGTKFTIVLEIPLGENEEDREPLPEMSILIVDDDEIFLETSAETLRDMGINPEIASSGEEALEMIRADHEQGRYHDVVIVDWKMPSMNGPESIKAIRSLIGDRIPVILVSAYDWTDIEDEAKESGASGFISKPLFRSYIYEELSKAIGIVKSKAAKESAYENDMKGKHLLVAEDNELNWEVLSDLLELYGMTADWAKNGKMCTDMVKSAPPGKYDFVLMDIQMPIMNGREASKVIRADERDYVNSIPIIALTADAFAEDIAECVSAGMDGHVSKPVEIDTLCREMNRVMRSRAAASAAAE